ncbi:hypothetical protein E0493_11190 [Roseomonas sp. M0104]|uniref:AAA family ATPase n=1 Tax=Teichococcus coralli TaxID=2545983 RepID=A0A845BKH0_9PROT|nr:AAA family ATPase [Pseudoroseomonas coralli]MXP63909.1 hypothetical protein [Pseudoroseomonas coralli]
MSEMVRPEELDGPAGFFETVVQRLFDDGLVCMPIPREPPEWLLPGLRQELERAASLRTYLLDMEELSSYRSPAHTLASQVMSVATGIRSVPAFVADDELAEAAFILHGFSLENWQGWTTFLRAFRHEWTRRGQAAQPLIVVCPPLGRPLQELLALVGAKGQVLPWRGQVQRIDTENAAFQLFGRPRPDDVALTVSVATAVELAGWDFRMLEVLARLAPADRLFPLDALTSIAAGMPDTSLTVPCWENSMVDGWDGGPYEHSLSLLKRGNEREVRSRIWRAQVRTLFPFLERVRQQVITCHHDFLADRLARKPITREFHSGQSKTYDKPEMLEPNDLWYVLQHHIPPTEADFLELCKRIRTFLAHMSVVPPDFITTASDWWLGESHRFGEACPGWTWPRTGQTLTLLVGPSGAGKSHYAARTYRSEEILSSDSIRVELGMPLANEGDQRPVFVELRKRLVARMAIGASVVVDATHLKREDRLANVRLVPEDMDVNYVVIDRPMPEKEAQAGWRLERPRLLADHSALFERGLMDILDGDQMPHVSVTDLRSEVE